MTRIYQVRNRAKRTKHPRATVRELATGGGNRRRGRRHGRWSFGVVTSRAPKAVRACVDSWLGRIAMVTQPIRASVKRVQVCVVRGNLEKANPE